MKMIPIVDNSVVNRLYEKVISEIPIIFMIGMHI